MNQDDFLWLQKWYQNNCNGDWEHGNGICLRTIDNPGWSLSISVEGLELEDKKFETVEVEHSDNDWFICFIKDKKFEARCGVCNLHEVFKIFKKWTTNNSDP